MGKKKIELLLLIGCLLFTLAFLPNMAMAEDPLPHHPTQGTAVVVVTDFDGLSIVCNVTSDLQRVGYSVSLLETYNATAANLRTGLRAGVIIWVGHGRIVGGQCVWVTLEYADGNDEKALKMLYTKYQEDFDSGRVVWSNITDPEPYCKVAITPSFISFYYAGDTAFPNSLWFNCVCHSLEDNSMAQAFLNSEGAVYMGWTEAVSQGYGLSTTMNVIDRLSNGDTVDEVVSEGYVDPEDPYAALDYEGDGEFSIEWAHIHDVAVTEVSSPKSAVGQGYVTNISVTLENQGTVSETFNVTLYSAEWNGSDPILTEIDKFLVSLYPGYSVNLEFVWDTTEWEKGNWTLVADASPIPEETDQTDNRLFGDVVFVTIPGDFDGDRDVDIYDIVAISDAYGTTEGEEGYNANCDITNDGKIDIYDVVIAQDHYGQSW